MKRTARSARPQRSSRSDRRTGSARSKPRRKPHRRLKLESLEDRRVMAAGVMHGMMHNVAQPEDVNDDGEISAIDALLTINQLNSGRPAGENATAAGGRRAFLDVNNDGDVSPIDVMMVINRLNRGRPDPRPPVQGEPRSVDGTDNNPENPEWGSTDSAYLRITTPEYADGISEPAGADRLSAREISNIVSVQDGAEENARGLSALTWQWGQFLDHDIDLTLSADPEESFPIGVPAGDSSFDPTGSGEQTIPLTRSNFDSTTGDSTDNPRQQVNSITAFIDGSNVYGSDADTAELLRTFEGGKLKTSDGDLLPFAENPDGSVGPFFQAGDIRANEQIGLISLHTLFVREHNRLADEIAERNPDLSDEQIYQRARSVVVAEMQAITYNEFLPALLGRNALGPYRGYDPSVNPGISNVFATAIYRFGHSMVSDKYELLGEDGELIEGGELALRDAFFNTGPVLDNGIDPIIRGLATQLSQEIDPHVVEDLRSFLFGPPGAGGLDLAALNIQRGRDHGLADYNQVRVDMGLEPVESFSDITSDPELQAQLAEAYQGDVNNIDAWVGALAEDHLPGAAVGELISTVLTDQFQRLRAGDRYWYQNVFAGERLNQLEHTRLSDVIERNTGIEGIQPNVFFSPDAQPPHRPGGPGGQNPNGPGGQQPLPLPPQAEPPFNQPPAPPTGNNQPPANPPANGPNGGPNGGLNAGPNGGGQGGNAGQGGQNNQPGGQQGQRQGRPTRVVAAIPANEFAQAADEVFTELGGGLLR
ncbi:MAG: peroxidase family protein [Pirellulaceae bacterium]